jgi:hypothetical protein
MIRAATPGQPSRPPYPDNKVSNMACGVLNDGGTDYIYCVGGNAGGTAITTGRAFRYNPVTDAITIVASPWPGDLGNILPGGLLPDSRGAGLLT